MKIDDVSWKILKILQENSRTSLKEIAKETGLSSPTIAERIQKMDEAGYVKDPLHLENLNARLAAYGELTTSLILKSIVSKKTFSHPF